MSGGGWVDEVYNIDYIAREGVILITGKTH